MNAQRLFALFSLASACAGRLAAADSGPVVQSYTQEVGESFGSNQGLPTGGAWFSTVQLGVQPAVLTDQGWFQFDGTRWSLLQGAPVEPDSVALPHSPHARIPVAPQAIRTLVLEGSSTWVMTSNRLWRATGGQVTSVETPTDRLNQLAIGPGGVLALAADAGFFERKPGGTWGQVRVADSLGRDWAAGAVLGTAFDHKGSLWIATKAGIARRSSEGWVFFEGKDGVPWTDFTGIEAGPDESVWFATRLGAIRWDRKSEFQYRQGPRWLPSDSVRSIAVDTHGHAWFATPGGVGVIWRKPMGLADKAKHFEDEIERHVKRTEFGFVAEAPLKVVADRSTANPQDSDNDGLWTAMYGAGECFAWAATKDPEARRRAKQAFEALRFLQVVTRGGSNSPPDGFVARTIRPTEWPDPNIGRIESDRKARAHGDRLWKVYEPRWPRSADGRWFWKGDTSSDELDGHYFFYGLYYDLVADSEPERDRVRDVVRRLTDHLLAHGGDLVDHDGTPTRWGVFGPASLNRDPNWWADRGLNSLSYLSYLAVAAHVAGDAKYEAASHDLIDHHGYAQNLMFPKVQFGPGTGNQSDDEMAVMCFYSLIRNSRDEALVRSARMAFRAYMAHEAPEMNPFFNFAHAACNEGRKVETTWGGLDLSSPSGWLADSAATLRGIPWDRLNWPSKNSHRLDVERFSESRVADMFEPTERPRGRLWDGKVIPVENRHFTHWNTDPWTLDYGGSGDELAAGTVFLLPYYMGLYHGFIQKP
jgi:hypothetical protein